MVKLEALISLTVPSTVVGVSTRGRLSAAACCEAEIGFAVPMVGETCMTVPIGAGPGAEPRELTKYTAVLANMNAAKRTTTAGTSNL